MKRERCNMSVKLPHSLHSSQICLKRCERRWHARTAVYSSSTYHSIPQLLQSIRQLKQNQRKKMAFQVETSTLPMTSWGDQHQQMHARETARASHRAREEIHNFVLSEPLEGGGNPATTSKLTCRASNSHFRHSSTQSASRIRSRLKLHDFQRASLRRRHTRSGWHTTRELGGLNETCCA